MNGLADAPSASPSTTRSREVNPTMESLRSDPKPNNAIIRSMRASELRGKSLNSLNSHSRGRLMNSVGIRDRIIVPRAYKDAVSVANWPSKPPSKPVQPVDITRIESDVLSTLGEAKQKRTPVMTPDSLDSIPSYNSSLTSLVEKQVSNVSSLVRSVSSWFIRSPEVEDLRRCDPDSPPIPMSTLTSSSSIFSPMQSVSTSRQFLPPVGSPVGSRHSCASGQPLSPTPKTVQYEEIRPSSKIMSRIT